MKATAAMLVAASLLAATGIAGPAQAADRSLAYQQDQTKPSTAIVLGDRELDDVYAGHVFFYLISTNPLNVSAVSFGSPFLPPHLGLVCLNGACFVVH